jgi:hypothetical protein
MIKRKAGKKGHELIQQPILLLFNDTSSNVLRNIDL